MFFHVVMTDHHECSISFLPGIVEIDVATAVIDDIFISKSSGEYFRVFRGQKDDDVESDFLSRRDLEVTIPFLVIESRVTTRS